MRTAEPMDAGGVEKLERALKALANSSRLHLLLALRQPRRLSDIDLPPSRTGPWGPEDRMVSRQAVRGQLRPLEEIGVVQATGRGAEVRYVVNHARLFEVTEQLRELATVRPEVAVDQDTLHLEATGGPERPAGPHLVLVRGVREGQVFQLEDKPDPEGVLIGRHRKAQVCLDYDPYVSSGHARILAREGGHFLLDLPTNRNRTYLNWRPMVRGGVAPLQPGDLIGVGMSLLLYRR